MSPRARRSCPSTACSSAGSSGCRSLGQALHRCALLAGGLDGTRHKALDVLAVEALLGQPSYRGGERALHLTDLRLLDARAQQLLQLWGDHVVVLDRTTTCLATRDDQGVGLHEHA